MTRRLLDSLLMPLISSDYALSKYRREIEEAFEKRGVEGAIQRTNRIARKQKSRTSLLPRVPKKKIVILGSRILREQGATEAEMDYLRHFASDRLLQNEEMVLRALYWAAMRNFEFLLAADSRDRIQAIKKIDISNDTRDWLERTSHIVGVKVISEAYGRFNTIQYSPHDNRVLYVLHNSLPFSSGGYATRAHGFARGLKENGVDVVCVTRPGFPHDLPGDFKGKDLETKSIVDEIPYHHIFEPGRPGHSPAEYMSKAADALVDVAKAYRPKCIIAASNHITAIPACIAARRLGIPFVYEVRGFWEITRLSREPEFANSSSYRRQIFFETEVAKAADHVITLTRPMRAELVDRGVEEAKISLAPNSCNPSDFAPRDKDQSLAQKLNMQDGIPVIGYVGTFVQYEGLDDLVEAASILKSNGLDFYLLLVGNENASGSDKGPITQKIQEIAERAGLKERLIMPGRVPHDEVDSYYSLIDIAPFPRKSQPVTEMVSPMKPLEALAMEKAVVVSSVKALEEMINHEETGLVFEKDNIQDLARILERLLNDSDLRRDLGRRGRRWVESDRTWKATTQKAIENMAQNYIQVLDDAATFGSENNESTHELHNPERIFDINLPVETRTTYQNVKDMFQTRDKELGGAFFSLDDWTRTKIAFGLFSECKKVIDIGIGQGQLVNLFSSLPSQPVTIGVDRAKHSKLIVPENEKFDIVLHDVTKDFPATLSGSDVTIAMEIFEHIDVNLVQEAVQRARQSSKNEMLFASVPYKEKHPLYHHDKPYGHKQSFDGDTVLNVFGDEAIWTNFKDRWYLIFLCADLKVFGERSFDQFVAEVKSAVDGI